jgi:hypothetical protein
MKHDLLLSLERTTLSQLCSKGCLAHDEANSMACTGLEKSGLAQRTLIGGWVPTGEGRRVNEQSEHSRGDGPWAIPKSPAGL